MKRILPVCFFILMLSEIYAQEGELNYKDNLSFKSDSITIAVVDKNFKSENVTYIVLNIKNNFIYRIFDGKPIRYNITNIDETKERFNTSLVMFDISEKNDTAFKVMFLMDTKQRKVQIMFFYPNYYTIYYTKPMMDEED